MVTERPCPFCNPRPERILRENPLCVLCRQAGKTSASEITDHIVPHKGDPNLFWNEANWQALCRCCHNRKTAVHDGRWG